MALAWSDRAPCGWVVVEVIRAVEKGKKRGFLVVRPVSQHSAIDNRHKKEHILHPDRIRL